MTAEDEPALNSKSKEKFIKTELLQKPSQLQQCCYFDIKRVCIYLSTGAPNSKPFQTKLRTSAAEPKTSDSGADKLLLMTIMNQGINDSLPPDNRMLSDQSVKTSSSNIISKDLVEQS